MRRRKAVIFILIAAFAFFGVLNTMKPSTGPSHMVAEYSQEPTGEMVYLNISYTLDNPYQVEANRFYNHVFNIMMYSDTQKYLSSDIYQMKQKHYVRIGYRITGEYAVVTMKCPKKELEYGKKILYSLLFENKMNLYSDKELQELYDINTVQSEEVRFLRTAGSLHYYGSADQSSKLFMEGVTNQKVAEFYKMMSEQKLLMTVVGDLTDYQVQSVLDGFDAVLVEQYGQKVFMTPVQNMGGQAMSGRQEGVMFYSLFPIQDEFDVAGLYMLKELLMAKIEELLASGFGKFYYYSVTVNNGQLGELALYIMTDEPDAVKNEVEQIIEELITDDYKPELFKRVSNGTLIKLENYSLLNEFIVDCNNAGISPQRQIELMTGSHSDQRAVLIKLLTKVGRNGSWFDIKRSETNEY